MDQLLPPFLERNYGEDVPIFLIHSLNMWIGMFGPSLAAALTMHLEAFEVMLPGLWVMALSPAWLAFDPSVEAVVCWIVFLSLGEVLWSPRLSAWIASVAPEGREGAFLALLSMKSLITTIPSTALNGWMNAVLNPNCPSCRDERTGHFCSELVRLNGTFDGCSPPGLGIHHACVGDEHSGSMVARRYADGSGLECPSTCQQCPGWEGDAKLMWTIVLLSSISSPVMVQLSLKYLRDS